MTKKRVNYLLKRYSYMMPAIRNGDPGVEISIGGRKEHIEFDSEVLAVLKLFHLAYENERQHETRMIVRKSIIQGRSDLSIIMENPCERSSYYRMKKNFIDKIYHCCIYEQLVPLEEILEENG